MADDNNTLQLGTEENNPPVNPTVSNFGLGDISEALTTDTILPDVSETLPINLDPQVKRVVDNVRQKTPRVDLPKSKFAQTGMDDVFNSLLGGVSQDNRLNVLDFNVNLNEVYTPLSDGTYIPKFDNYISGTNNEQRLALEQGTGDKWVNGIVKNVFAKTALNVIDGTIGTVYGLVNGIAEGSFSAVYDNGFSNFIDDLNKRLDNSLPNYYTEQEKNAGFLESLGTANFWVNDFAGGLSFMYGTIISEAIWAYATGGASLATLGARGVLKAGAKSLGKQALHTPTKLLNRYMRTIPASQTAKALNNARFLYTSAGFEAGVEARHYLNEQEANYIQSYQLAFGRRPDPRELAQFRRDLTTSANTLFAANVALVGSSNIAQFGTYFGLQAGVSKRVNKYLGKKIGLGVTSNIDKGKQVFNALDASPIQKAAGKVLFVAKAPFVEGFVEEGGQAVLSGTGERWLASRYNPESLKENYELIEAAFDSFSHVYGSKEGFKEIGLGALVGLFGQAGRGFNLREYDKRAQANITQAEILNKYSNQNLINKLSAVTQQKSAYFDALNAQEKGEVLQASLDLKRGLFSKMLAEYNSDLLDDSHANFQKVIESTPDETIAQQFGVDVSEVQSVKDDLLEDYETSVDDFKKSIRIAESILPESAADLQVQLDGTTQSIPSADLRSLLALNLFMGKNSDRLASQYAKEIAELLGDDGVYSALEQKRMLERAGVENVREYNKILEEMESIDKTLNEDNDAFIQAGIRKSNAKEGELEKIAQREEELALKRERLNKRRTELDNELLALSKKIDRATKAYNIVNQEFQNPFFGEEVSPEALIQFSDRLTELEQTLDTWKESNPQAYDRITYLLDQYRKAEFAFVSVNEGFNRLSDPRFRPKEARRIFGKVFSKLNRKKVNSDDLQTFTSDTYAFLANAFYADQSLFDSAPGTQSEEDTSATQEEVDQQPDDFPTPTRENIDPDLNIDQRSENPLLDALNKRINDIVSQRKSLESFDPSSFSREDIVTQSEIDEFKNLLRKKRRNINGLRPADVDRFRELKLKINNYGRLQGTVDSGSRLSDLLQQSVMLQEIETNQFDIKPDSNSKEALSDLVDPVFEGTQSKKNADNTQTYEKAFVKKEFNGDYNISNINIQGLLNVIGASSQIEIRRGRSKGLIQDINSITNVKPGNKFTIKFVGPDVGADDGPVATFKIGAGNNILFTEKTKQVLDEFSNLEILPTSNLPTSYQTLLRTLPEQGGSTEVIPVDTNFTLEPGVVMNPQALASLENGDEVFLEVSTRNEYNKILFSNVTGDQVQPDLSDTQRKELQDNMVIYVRSGANVVAVLKRGENFVSLTDENLQALNQIRKFALDKVLEERFAENQIIDLQITIPVNFAYLGHPNFTMTKVNGEVQVNNLTFDDTALSKVQDLGYIENGELSLNKGLKGINTIYVNSYSKKNKDQKIPIIVFSHLGKKIAYPVSLNAVNQGLAQRLDDILGTSLPIVEKIENLNSLLVEARLDVGTLGFYFNNREDTNVNDTAHIANVRNQLSEVVDFADVSEWLNLSFEDAKTALSQQAVINIDIANKPFHSPKLKLNIKEFSTPAAVQPQENVVTQELGEKLTQEAEKIKNTDC